MIEQSDTAAQVPNPKKWKNLHFVWNYNDKLDIYNNSSIEKAVNSNIWENSLLLVRVKKSIRNQCSV